MMIDMINKVLSLTKEDLIKGIVIIRSGSKRGTRKLALRHYIP